MNDASLNIIIGGEAGQGLATVGEFLAKALVRAGYHLVVTQSYMSRIRGGHNTFVVRVGPEEVLAPVDEIDLLVALDAETLSLHKDDLAENAVVLADAAHDNFGLRGLKIPYKSLCPKPIYENVAALGVLCSLLCLEKRWLTDLIDESFAKKGEDVIATNLKVFEDALAWTGEQNLGFSCIAQPPEGRGKRLMLQCNEAVALGGMAAGVNFCSFYPMTPSTSVALTLISKGKDMGVVVEQAEDEIAAVNMALGASYAGATVMVPTSGGGFSLMMEGVSLSGMLETPLVIVLAMRPGPATGLPTRTEQGDLNLGLYAGHGEFPRAIYAPANPEQGFELGYRAVDAAERFQGPVFVLTDQFLADSYRSVPVFDPKGLPAVAKPLTAWDSGEAYQRYAVTDDGVSPRLLPGFTTELVVADSDEHTPDGHITEDLTVRTTMQDKRMRKLQGLLEAVIPPSYHGDENPGLLLVCWGSTRGAALEAMGELRGRGEKAAVLHFSQVYPLRPEDFLERLKAAGKTVMVEGNFEGQFAQLVRRETGYSFDALITRYDGLPFTAKYILDRLPGDA